MTAETKQYGPTFAGNYPETMRTQLWPLCCGMSILSGFKDAGPIPEDQLIENINNACDVMVPDMQVYPHEKMRPSMIFLTLNNGQMSSPKIMSAIEKAGFVRIGTGQPRGNDQGLFLRDKSKTFKLVA